MITGGLIYKLKVLFWVDVKLSTQFFTINLNIISSTMSSKGPICYVKFRWSAGYVNISQSSSSISCPDLFHSSSSIWCPYLLHTSSTIWCPDLLYIWRIRLITRPTICSKDYLRSTWTETWKVSIWSERCWERRKFQQSKENEKNSQG